METEKTIGCKICNCYQNMNTQKSHIEKYKDSGRKCPVCGTNCGKPALLDLFSGAGGAARGYQQAGFCVLGVDINPQPRYAGCRFHQADALTYSLKGFDVIHASPPCQAYSKCTGYKYRKKHPKLIAQIRKRLEETGKPYIIENVEGARHQLRQYIMLCGSMFGLPIRRHRFFEINPMLDLLLLQCNHKPNPVYITGTPRPKDGSPRKDPSANVKRAAMKTPWMTIKNMDEAIPPAYTKYIGKHLMRHITNCLQKQGIEYRKGRR